MNQMEEEHKLTFGGEHQLLCLDCWRKGGAHLHGRGTRGSEAGRPALQHPGPPHISQRRELHNAGPQKNSRRRADDPQILPRSSRHHRRALGLLPLALSGRLQTHLPPRSVLRFYRVLKSAHGCPQRDNSPPCINQLYLPPPNSSPASRKEWPRVNREIEENLTKFDPDLRG